MFKKDSLDPSDEDPLLSKIIKNNNKVEYGGHKILNKYKISQD